MKNDTEDIFLIFLTHVQHLFGIDFENINDILFFGFLNDKTIFQKDQNAKIS